MGGVLAIYTLRAVPSVCKLLVHVSGITWHVDSLYNLIRKGHVSYGFSTGTSGGH